jgi:hypothetical protein
MLAAMTCIAGLWPASASAAAVTYRGEYETGLAVTLKFSVKNGTTSFKGYKTAAPVDGGTSVANCDGGETVNFTGGTGVAAPPEKVKNGTFVFKSKGDNFGAGQFTTKLVGELKGNRVEGSYTVKNFDDGQGHTGCSGKVTYTATK